MKIVGLAVAAHFIERAWLASAQGAMPASMPGPRPSKTADGGRGGHDLDAAMRGLIAGEAAYGDGAMFSSLDDDFETDGVEADEARIAKRQVRSSFIGLDPLGKVRRRQPKRLPDARCPTPGSGWGSRTTGTREIKSSAQRAQQASFRMHAESIFIAALAHSRHISISQSQTTLATVKAQFADRGGMQSMRSGPLTPLTSDERRTLSAYTQFLRQISQHHDSGDASLALASLARALLTGAQPHMPSTRRRAVQLVEAMWEAEQAGAPGYAETGPLTALRAACQLGGKDLSEYLSSGYVALRPFDPDCLTAAALFWHCARPANGPFPEMHRAAEKALSAAYLNRLEKELTPHRQAAELIPVREIPAGGGPWFDGLAIRGAFNRRLEALAQALAVDGRSEKDSLTLLKRRFTDLAESMDYPIGTPFQSMATICLRLGPMYGMASDGLAHPPMLIERFRELTQAWFLDRAYPLSPHLLAASHLAHASDVVLGTSSEVDKALVRKLRPREILSGDPRQIVNLIPFVGSGLDFLKGLVRQDRSLALSGGLRLGLDALFVWLGGAMEGSVAGIEAKLIGSSNGERLALTTLRVAAPEHGLAAKEGIPLLPHDGLALSPFEAPFSSLPRQAKSEWRSEAAAAATRSARTV